MKRTVLALVVALILMALIAPAAVFAADEGYVTCTVSVFLVSVLVQDGEVAYGALALGATNNTINLGDTQAAINDGTVYEDFGIKSSNATMSGGTNWTLVTGTPLTDEFKHEFSTDSGGNWTAMTDTSYQLLAENVKPPSGFQTFDLQITMPSAAKDCAEHVIQVTVLATQH